MNEYINKNSIIRSNNNKIFFSEALFRNEWTNFLDSYTNTVFLL